MARRKTTADGAEPEPAAQPTTWRHVLSVGLLLGSVAGVLLLAAVLQVDPPVEREPALAAPLAAVAPPLPAAPPAEAAWIDALGRRATDDADRAATAAESWTAQLAVLCDKEGARRIVERFGGEERLYVLPVDHADQICLALCWGLYADATQARAAADMPAGLRALHPKFFAKRVADVVAEHP